MENRTWQPIPEIAGAFVYPYIRAPDVLSSNSYLIEFPDRRLLIDPGALPQQTQELHRILAAREGPGIRPLLACITHCHLDHSREAKAWLDNARRPAWLSAQEHGARALAAGDSRLTAAELYGLDMPCTPAHIPLMTAADVRERQSRCIRLADGCETCICTTAHGDALRQTLTWGGDTLEILPCAGHSPDSLCFRVGDLLFIGDLLSASRPLVAGLHGWNPGQLKQSLAGIIRLLEGGSIHWCCPGHGHPLPAGKTLELLRRQQGQLDLAGEIEEMNLLRLFRTVDCALELVAEAEEVFSAIAGRVLYVADRLDMLGEPEMARRCRKTLDLDVVDALLQAFRDRCQALSAGHIPQVAFALEAVSLVEKIRACFQPEPLQAFLPASLINRAQRLLLDFMGIARGTRNLEEFIPVDIGALLVEAERTWNSSPHLDETILNRTENPEQFAAELARRIGHPPPAQRMPVAFDCGPGAPLVPVAAVRFNETLVQFLEWLALSGAPSAQVADRRGTCPPVVEIRYGGRLPPESPRQRTKQQSFARRFALAGFELRHDPGLFRLVHSPDCTPAQ